MRRDGQALTKEGNYDDQFSEGFQVKGAAHITFKHSANAAGGTGTVQRLVRLRGQVREDFERQAGQVSKSYALGTCRPF